MSFKKNYYKLLESHDRVQLMHLVDDEIQKGLGWEPQGSMINFSDFGQHFVQPMVRKFINRKKAQPLSDLVKEGEG